jgi:hypothetical protein
MRTDQIVGLFGAFIGLAMFSVAAYSPNTPKVLKATGDMFTGLIRAATLQPGGRGR